MLSPSSLSLGRSLSLPPPLPLLLLSLPRSPFCFHLKLPSLPSLLSLSRNPRSATSSPSLLSLSRNPRSATVTAASINGNGNGHHHSPLLSPPPLLQTLSHHNHQQEQEEQDHRHQIPPLSPTTSSAEPAPSPISTPTSTPSSPSPATTSPSFSPTSSRSSAAAAPSAPSSTAPSAPPATPPLWAPPPAPSLSALLLKISSLLTLLLLRLPQIIEMHGERLELYVGLDVDPVAHEKGRAQIERTVKGLDGLKAYTHLRNFKYVKSVLGGIDENLLSVGVDGMLMDLGMSSMQVNDSARGFSVIGDGPLDMRMNPKVHRLLDDKSV